MNTPKVNSEGHRMPAPGGIGFCTSAFAKRVKRTRSKNKQARTARKVNRK